MGDDFAAGLAGFGAEVEDPIGFGSNSHVMFDDHNRVTLIDVLHRLVDEGHTVVVIEHHMAVAAEADWILDLGPEAGDGGGKIIAEGPPEKVAKSKTSRTAPFLKIALRL